MNNAIGKRIAFILLFLTSVILLASCEGVYGGEDVILTDPESDTEESLSPDTTEEGKPEETEADSTADDTSAAPETTIEPETTLPEPETTAIPETTLPEETEVPWNLVLVNPWNPLPKDHTVELKTLSDNSKIDARCAEALERFVADCRAAGYTPYICSSYRTWDDQTYLFEKKVSFFVAQGYSDADARVLAAKETAVPGTSEHQLGLAADIICISRPWLDDGQADTETQKWLMANCHKYGFILRYPKGTTNITGIIYEPWHYRYVGVEIATEIMTRGITLEEYLSGQ